MAKIKTKGLKIMRRLFSGIVGLTMLITGCANPNQEKTSRLDQPQEMDNVLLETILERSAAAKAKVVRADEHEAGLRAILNYGHTFGHVVETLCGYGTWLHGEAVAIGMVAVGELAVQRQSWSREAANRQKALIKKAGLPTSWPTLNKDAVMRTLQGDKKVKDGKIRFVIPTSIGKVEIQNDISKSEIETCLSKLS